MAPDFDPEALVRDGGLVWRYKGQARYSSVPKPIDGPIAYVPREHVESLAEQLRRTSRWNSDGSMWAVAGIVPAGMIDAVSEPDERDSDEAFDWGGETDSDPADGARAPISDGTPQTWYPMSWDNRECDGNSKNGDDDSEWNGESRTVVSSPSAPRDRTAVSLSAEFGDTIYGEVRSCTGVMITSRWVLTAAHCVVDDDGNTAHDVTATSWTDEDVSASSSFIFDDGAYTGTLANIDPDDDFAMIHLQSAFDDDPGDMDLSQAGNTELNSVGAAFHNLGFPAYLNHCTENSALTHASDYDITYKGSQTLRWTGDVSKGQSGGPVYYCPAGDVAVCASSDKGLVVAVVSGWLGFPTNRMVGARVSHFRDWAICLTNGGDDDSCLPL